MGISEVLSFSLCWAELHKTQAGGYTNPMKRYSPPLHHPGYFPNDENENMHYEQLQGNLVLQRDRRRKKSLERSRKHGRGAGTHKDNDQRRVFTRLLSTISL